MDFIKNFYEAIITAIVKILTFFKVDISNTPDFVEIPNLEDAK